MLERKSTTQGLTFIQLGFEEYYSRLRQLRLIEKENEIKLFVQELKDNYNKAPFSEYLLTCIGGIYYAIHHRDDTTLNQAIQGFNDYFTKHRVKEEELNWIRSTNDNPIVSLIDYLDSYPEIQLKVGDIMREVMQNQTYIRSNNEENFCDIYIKDYIESTIRGKKGSLLDEFASSVAKIIMSYINSSEDINKELSALKDYCVKNNLTEGTSSSEDIPTINSLKVLVGLLFDYPELQKTITIFIDEVLKTNLKEEVFSDLLIIEREKNFKAIAEELNMDKTPFSEYLVNSIVSFYYGIDYQNDTIRNQSIKDLNNYFKNDQVTTEELRYIKNTDNHFISLIKSLDFYFDPKIKVDMIKLVNEAMEKNLQKVKEESQNDHFEDTTKDEMSTLGNHNEGSDHNGESVE